MSSPRSRLLKVYGSDQERQTWYGLAQAKQLTFSRFMRSLLEREAAARSPQSSQVGLQCCRELARCLTLLQREGTAIGEDRLAEICEQSFVALRQLEQEVSQ
jgi:hypothetical protein